MKTDARLEVAAEILISRLLHVGVTISAVLLVVGTVLVFHHHPLYRSSPDDLPTLTSPDSEYPHSIREVLRMSREGRGQGIAMLGLLMLIATPVLRVAVSIVLFAIERDWLFTTITAVVLALLLLAFVIGAGG
jgi:uncharacterized membrane protein